MPPRTIVVNPAAPSNSLSFVVPAYVKLDVESVFAAVDASAAGDTTALLEVADGSGAVIARKRQGEKVAGGTAAGSATWALRLADEQVGGPAPGGGIQFDTEPQAGDWLDIETTASDANGYGFHFRDQGSTRGVLIESDSQSVQLNAGNQLNATGAQGWSVAGGPGSISGVLNAVVVQLADRAPAFANGQFEIVGINGGNVLMRAQDFHASPGSDEVRFLAHFMGFFGAGTVAKPTVAGSRGGNAALASLLTALANLGLITNSTTP